jgi:tetratricopeptide (TPR) repeat protein
MVIDAEGEAMRRAGWMLGLVFLVGCVFDEQDRVRQYSDDGLYLFRCGDYRSAREDFQAALALEPENPVLLYNVGRCYDLVGDTAKAERTYNECLSQSPNYVECRHALADLQIRTGRRDEAARQVEDWLAREPQLAAAYAEDGWLWHQFGDLPRAQARLQQAVELDPKEPHALIELARVYEAMQRPDRAVDLYEQVLRQKPNQPELVKRVNLLRSQGTSLPHPD